MDSKYEICIDGGLHSGQTELNDILDLESEVGREIVDGLLSLALDEGVVGGG